MDLRLVTGMENIRHQWAQARAQDISSTKASTSKVSLFDRIDRNHLAVLALQLLTYRCH